MFYYRLDSSNVVKFTTSFTLICCSDRWLCYCNVPTYCDSLPCHDTSAIFGRTFLRLIYSTVQRQLMDRFIAEKDRLPPERRDMIINQFPKFLADMEMELGNDASPVWDPSYVHRPANHHENIKGFCLIRVV